MALYEKENAKKRNGRRVFATDPVAYPLRPLRSLRFPLLCLKSLRHLIRGSLKRAFVAAFIVRDKSRTYLSNSGNCNGNRNRNRNGETQIPCGDDNKKDNNKKDNNKKG
jgi:hypothetical protein